MRIMKLFFVAVMAFVGLNCYSQEFKGGLLAGMSASQIDGDGLAGYDKIGLAGGVFLSRELNDVWEAQFEMRFMQKGAANHSSDYKITLNYIELPFLAHYKFKKKYVFEAGLVPAVFLWGTESARNLTSDIEYWKFSLDARLGAYYKFNDNFAFSAQFVRSILPIYSYTTKYDTKSELAHSLIFLLYYSL